MPNILDENGLQVKTADEITSELKDSFRAIYGADINVEQNSPDGQIIGIFSQALADQLELVSRVYNSFDPDRSQGRNLDERVVINNIARQGGTYTIVPVEITVDRTVNLAGLDANFNDPNGTGFTVSDDAGNQFILIDSQVLTAGTTTVNFRAQLLGAVEVTVNTITNATTIVLGVTGVNNTSGALETGTPEETDSELRLRRQQSVALASQGYLNGLLGAVLNIEGVSDAALFENVANVTDADGIPPHSIWLIVEGGANTDIANQIFGRKTAGAGMRGDVIVDIENQSGQVQEYRFDRPIAENLFIQFNIQPTTTGATFDQDAIKQNIVSTLSYRINEAADTSLMTQICTQAIADTGASGVAVNVLISIDDVSYIEYIEPSTLQNQFVIDVSRIDITEL